MAEYFFIEDRISFNENKRRRKWDSQYNTYFEDVSLTYTRK